MNHNPSIQQGEIGKKNVWKDEQGDRKIHIPYVNIVTQHQREAAIKRLNAGLKKDEKDTVPVVRMQQGSSVIGNFALKFIVI